MLESMPAARQNMTVAEFLTWESGDDLRYQLIRGRVVAMAPTTRIHQVLTTNLARTLSNALRARRRECLLLTEAGIASGHDTAYIADLVMSCSPIATRDERLSADPILIVEILSPSTEEFDRTTKLFDYRNIDSVQEIVLVSQSRVFCEIHRRVEAGWMTDLLSGPDARLEIRSIPAEILLGEIYEGVRFPEERLPE
jgi:Uma2 family endonuclease